MPTKQTIRWWCKLITKNWRVLPLLPARVLTLCFAYFVLWPAFKATERLGERLPGLEWPDA